ncbi:ent-kaurenoic acid oxidase 1-like [Neltuma alba]|uniref:ent-kaurenoic acid oxidase 1-like n=1 Tax=Neltuma alba TaxID=207710 RepID=UPI0010A4D3D1|nr:ent-kaurenoic acid oxidase 1-like [Prosopis alba]
MEKLVFIYQILQNIDSTSTSNSPALVPTHQMGHRNGLAIVGRKSWFATTVGILGQNEVEQEEIIRRRPPIQTRLTLKEIRQMEYLSKVIDETMRLVTFSLTVFREAKSDVNINIYLVPKGWRALAWFRTIHYDPKIYPNPMEFNPSRWDNFIPKATEFMPFGVRGRSCPGNELAKLEIIVFLHHFILNYRLEQLNPKSPVMYLPQHTRPVDNCMARVHKISKA